MKCITDAIRAEIGAQFAYWMPKLIDQVVTAIAVGGAQAASDGVDHATDLIPGELDDQILDPIAEQAPGVVRGILKRIGFGR